MIERRSTRRGESRRATYSDCELYRYTLEIIWLPSKPLVQFIGLNPSTATEEVDDPTLRRCKGFAGAWGFGGLIMTNVSPYRATDPREMLMALNLGGPEQSAQTLASFAASGVVDLVVAAWGTHGANSRLKPYTHAIRQRFGNSLQCLGVTKNRQPLHPLYQPADAELVNLEAAIERASK